MYIHILIHIHDYIHTYIHTCTVFINVMASFHYTLKVLVCYGYLVRMDLVFSSGKGKKKSTVPLKVYIFIVWTGKLI